MNNYINFLLAQQIHYKNWSEYKMIYLLFVLLLLLLIIIIYTENLDLLCPPSIICAMWLFSTICAIYNVDKWNIHLSFETLFLIITGISTFSIGFFCFYRTPIKTITLKKKAKNFNYISLQEISVNWIIIWILIFLGVITIFFQLNWIFKISDSDSWLDMMWSYRKYNSTWRTTSLISKPSFIVDLEFLLRVDSLFTSYIGVNNLIVTQKKRYFLLFIPGILYSIDTLLNAGRGNILLYLGGVVLAIYVIAGQKYSWKKKRTIKFVKWFVLAGVLLLLLFSTSRTLVGRIDSSNIIDYITSYVGGSIQLFDLYVKNPIPKSTIWGKETFAPFIIWLGNKLHKPEWIYLTHLEFRSSNGVEIGNVYGTFRYYLQDFGFLGMLILTLFSSFFFAILYKKIKKRKFYPSDGYNWFIFFYMIYGPALFMHPISDYTYSFLCQIVFYGKYILYAWILKKIIINISN